MGGFRAVRSAHGAEPSLGEGELLALVADFMPIDARDRAMGRTQAGLIMVGTKTFSSASSQRAG